MQKPDEAEPNGPVERINISKDIFSRDEVSMKNEPTSKRRKSRGSSLLELMVASSIVGALGALGATSYCTYIEKAFDLQTRVDIKNIALAEETVFTDSYQYQACKNKECRDLPGMRKLAPSTVVEVTVSDSGYKIVGYNSRGSQDNIIWDSDAGGFIDDDYETLDKIIQDIKDHKSSDPANYMEVP